MFKTEKQLVNTITKSVVSSGLRNFVKPSLPINVFKELNLGYGIADIVFVQYYKEINGRGKFFDYFDLSILKIIENEKKTTLEEIHNSTKTTTHKIRQSIKKLEEEGFIKIIDKKYLPKKKYNIIVKNSIAIEAKLRDWRRGLKQAYRYNWFSSKSFVFLPQDNIDLAINDIALFQKLNVGLASINKEGEITIAYNPKHSEPHSERMSRLLNEKVLNALLKK